MQYADARFLSKMSDFYLRSLLEKSDIYSRPI